MLPSNRVPEVLFVFTAHVLLRVLAVSLSGTEKPTEYSGVKPS